MLELVLDILPSNITIAEVDLIIQNVPEILENEIEQSFFHKLLMAGTRDSFWQLKQDLRKQLKNTKTQRTLA